MKKLIALYLIVGFAYFFNQNANAQEFFNFRSDPDNAHGGYASAIFDSVKFISLETTKESLFGTIDQL